MLKIYKTTMYEKKIKKIKRMSQDSWIDLTNPTREEINRVVEKTEINSDLIYKMLDADELPRIEIDNNATLIVIDTPLITEEKEYITHPLGIIITKSNYVITVSTKKIDILDDFKKNIVNDFRTAKKTRFVIQILIKTINKYLRILKRINKDIDDKEEVLKQSTKNEDLIDLLGIEKTLVYFITSLRENKAVLDRLKRGNVIPLYEGDSDLLDDAVVEMNQAIDMATIYRDILGSITDTYATIVSNNLNDGMKFLAGMTIVLSIPTIISSFLGMNVKFGYIGISEYSAISIFIGSIILSIIVAIWLKKKGML
ncbi:MAG: magnesium transporter CorA family protein [Bacilli bacterium]|nr:magnesium transporter CorA family protein [Bacilli bacterium]